MHSVIEHWLLSVSTYNPSAWQVVQGTCGAPRASWVFSRELAGSRLVRVLEFLVYWTSKHALLHLDFLGLTMICYINQHQQWVIISEASIALVILEVLICQHPILTRAGHFQQDYSPFWRDHTHSSMQSIWQTKDTVTAHSQYDWQKTEQYCVRLHSPIVTSPQADLVLLLLLVCVMYGVWVYLVLSLCGCPTSCYGNMTDLSLHRQWQLTHIIIADLSCCVHIRMVP